MLKQQIIFLMKYSMASLSTDVLFCQNIVERANENNKPHSHARFARVLVRSSDEKKTSVDRLKYGKGR